MDTTKAKEIGDRLTRIAADPFEFLKYVKIKHPGNLALDYILWPHLVDFYKALNTYKLLDLIKAKQIGISWALAIHALRQIYTIPGWNVIEISKGEKEAQSLLEKSQIVYHNLPEWMKYLDIDMKIPIILEPNNLGAFGFKQMGSKITAFSTTETAGIGETAGLVIHDEADFHDYYEVNLSHTRATVADSPERQLISVSTVDKTKPDSPFKEHWLSSNNGNREEVIDGIGDNGFKALFYGYDVRPDRDERFYSQMVEEYKQTPWVVEANWPRSVKEALAPLVATSCFKADRLQYMWDNVVEVKPERDMIYIITEPRVGVVYAAGADVGEGVGLDFSSLTILGKEGGKSWVAAVILTNTLATDLFAYEMDRLGRKYFDVILGVENNSMGVAVTNKLEELNYPNLYYSDTGKKKAGWTTGEKNKHTATVELVNVVDDGSLISQFKPQVKEMMEYQWVQKADSYKPAPTGKTHGDTVISLMIAVQMQKEVGTEEMAHMYVGGKKIW